MRLVEVCALDDLPEGSMRLVRDGLRAAGVYHLGDELYALEDRCSHDDGPLCEGDFDADEGVAVCPRHGARFDIRTGRPLSLPAVEPVATYPVRIENGRVLVDLDAPSLAA